MKDNLVIPPLIGHKKELVQDADENNPEQARMNII